MVVACHCTWLLVNHKSQVTHQVATHLQILLTMHTHLQTDVQMLCFTKAPHESSVAHTSGQALFMQHPEGPEMVNAS